MYVSIYVDVYVYNSFTSINYAIGLQMGLNLTK